MSNIVILIALQIFILILIGMIRGLSRPLLRFQPKIRNYQLSTPTNLCSITTPNRYFFANTFDRQAFVENMDKEMKQMRNQIDKFSGQNLGFFQKEGWVVSYHPLFKQVQYRKMKHKYQVRVISGIMSNPPNAPDSPPLEPEQYGKSNKIKYCPVDIWLRKKGSDSWFVFEMGVMEGSVTLLSACFKKGEPRVKWDWDIYVGPDVNSLPGEVTDVIDYLFKEVGLSTQMIMNMVINNSRQADQLDYQWLVDLKQLLS